MATGLRHASIRNKKPRVHPTLHYSQTRSYACNTGEQGAQRKRMALPFAVLKRTAWQQRRALFICRNFIRARVQTARSADGQMRSRCPCVPRRRVARVLRCFFDEHCATRLSVSACAIRNFWASFQLLDFQFSCLRPLAFFTLLTLPTSTRLVQLTLTALQCKPQVEPALSDNKPPQNTSTCVYGCLKWLFTQLDYSTLYILLQ